MKKAILLLAFALGGCAQGKVYPLAPDEAAQALNGTSIPAIAFGMAAYSDPGEAVPGGVAWHIFRVLNGGAPFGKAGADGEMLILTARVGAASAGSAIAVEVAPAAAADAKAFARGVASKPAVAAMFRAILTEHIDATLTHRDFSMDNIRSSMLLATAEMMPLLREQMKQSDAQRERADRARIDAASSAHHAVATHDRAQGLTVDLWR